MQHFMLKKKIQECIQMHFNDFVNVVKQFKPHLYS